MGRKRIRMSSLEDLRRAVNRVNNMLVNGEIDAKTANALIYGCNVARGIIKVGGKEEEISPETRERVAALLRGHTKNDQ